MNSPSPTLRFAPSPTGLLHVGNARTALFNWLFARKRAGRFILRFDDTDVERCKPEYAAAIEHDLGWLGLDWDGVERQSARLDRYQAAFDVLLASGRLYPCYETPEELAYKRRRQRARGLPPVYDRGALALSADDRAALEAGGRRPHWRFGLDRDTIAWADLVRGAQTIAPASISDPVVRREDGTFLYMLPSVVDDIDMAVSHVLRGEDHVVNTAVQLQMFAALGAPPPAFGHLPLIADFSGEGLSKRLGSRSLADLRAEGVEAPVLAAYLTGLGAGGAMPPEAGMGALIDEFDLGRYGRATAKFDPDQLRHANDAYLHRLDYEAVAGRLADLGLERADAAFWEAVRANLDRLGDAVRWHAVCFDAIEPVIEEPDFLSTAAGLLPPEPWDHQTWPAWTEAVRHETGRKGKALFRPLRLALTGLEHGPGLDALLPLIGRRRALARLTGKPETGKGEPAP